MTQDKPFIDPNSGAATQPGGYVTPGYVEPVEEVDAEEAVESQTQDDPSGQDAVDPDANSDDTGDSGDTTGSTGSDDSSDSGDTGDAGAYNPSEHNAADVLEYISQHPEEKDAILAAEEADKKRKTILDA